VSCCGCGDASVMDVDGMRIERVDWLWSVLCVS
jgi:hypothetical protein